MAKPAIPISGRVGAVSRATELDIKDKANLLPSSLLEPRIAVVLNVPKSYRPWLFLCRLLSISPAIVWGTTSALELLLQIIPVSRTYSCPPDGAGSNDVIPFPLTETLLGVMWCGASAYLSFFFTDCLMSRWLINYTPQATLIRLLTINMTNAYVTSWILFLAGGFDDSRLLLPGWISIATTLTVCYHITQRKINIRKETSTSINIFSMASFISLVALLGLVHNRSDYPEIPLITIGRSQWEAGLRLVEGITVAPHASDSL